MRTIGSDGEKTKQAILNTSHRLITQHGFEAVSMRQLAREIGIQAGSFYHYFQTKEDLLFEIMINHMLQLQEALEKILINQTTPIEKLLNFIENHVKFHIKHRHQTHISNMELRSLNSENRTKILALRSQYEQRLKQILSEGIAQNQFKIEDITLTTIAIIQMITGIIVWFRPDQRLTLKDISHNYQQMILRMLAVKEPQ